MGIYDRDYYRREGPSYLDSFNVRGQIVAWLLGINIAIFLFQVATREQRNYGWEPGVVTRFLELNTHKIALGEVWRLVTYAFLHNDGTSAGTAQGFWTHIFFNMWMLFLFGGYLEEFYGRWEFLTFYLVSAFVGGLAFFGASFTPLQPGRICLGASGAVTASMILCAFRYPRLTILLFFVIPVPIWLLAGFQVLQDSLGFLTGGNNQTAFSVHLGGAAFAAFYFQTNFRLLRLIPNWKSWNVFRPKPRLRVYRPEDAMSEPVAIGAPPSRGEVDEQLEAKVDAVLEKVARTGQSSLTEQERQILFQASEMYKKKRI